ncbi:MAG: CoA-binding protein [Pirellulales bacterium]
MSQPSVAILGASADRAKFGNKSVRAHAKAGYIVYPVNPKGGTIEGLPVHPSLAAVPVARLNRVSVYLPPARSLAALAEIAAKGCDEVWFNPGSASAEVMDRARELGLNAVGGCSIVDLGLSPAEFP